MARSKEFEEKEILEKAGKLFSSKGYSGISMQELVDGLEINRSSIYDTFGDKHALFLAALKHYRVETAGKMIAVLEQSTNIRQTLTEILRSVLEESDTDTTKAGCFLVNASIELAPHEKEVNKIVVENTVVLEEALAKALRKAQGRNEIASRQPPRALARFFLNTLNGLRVMEKTACDRKAMEDIVKVTLSVLDNPACV